MHIERAGACEDRGAPGHAGAVGLGGKGTRAHGKLLTPARMGPSPAPLSVLRLLALSEIKAPLARNGQTDGVGRHTPAPAHTLPAFLRRRRYLPWGGGGHDGHRIQGR